MTSTERPYWLSNFHVRESSLQDSNLKDASRNEIPAYLSTMMYGRTQTLQAPNPTKEQIEQMYGYGANKLLQATKTKSKSKTKQAKVTRGMILNAAKILNVPTPMPNWLQTRRLLNL